MSDHYKENLDAQLDANGDIAPPWVKYPTYGRHAIGWRMGAGEHWMSFLWAFLERLGDDRDTRVAYLRRHPPAPLTWADWILSVLGDEPGTIDEATLAALQADGFIAPDAAFAIYCARPDDGCWPWDWKDCPSAVARYRTRELALWSRRYTRGEPRAITASVPEPWQAFARAHAERRAPESVRLSAGLDALAVFLAVGWPPAPWACDLRVASFADAFDDDVGYADAFRLWLMSTFDDGPTFRAYATTQPTPPAAWANWMDEQLDLPGEPTPR